ncbi:MAG: nucleotidyltransferase domain-containing protein [Trueperaceae bacterium]|nr:nucleotidyltransferase domain-containing protein [Trueperaceae bacterium]
MTDLDFTGLPELPQVPYLKKVVETLWQDSSLIAVWLGGSLARGAGDKYSDLDLRIAVKEEELADWENRGLEAYFAGGILSQHTMKFGAPILHHLLVANGDIYDLYIQSTETALSSEARLIFACRDEAFLAKLETPATDPTVVYQEAKAEEIKTLLDFYWLNAHKHRKGLHRDLNLLIWEGLNLFRPVLLRLHYIEETGKDCGDLRRSTIHAMTPVVRVLQAAEDQEFRAVVSSETLTLEDQLSAISALNMAVSQVGRRLAQRYGFAYPEALEELVTDQWDAYVQQARGV